MDRTSFINLAPEYYMLALFVYCEYPEHYYSEEGFVERFKVSDEDRNEDCYVGNATLRKEALRLLIKHDAIETIEDPFGPTLWKRGKGYEALQDMLDNNPISPFYKARISGDRKGWLTTALIRVNETAFELGISSADFDGEPIDEWEPIAIDQGHATVKQAVERLQETTAAIEQDNGYAATYPQERDQVVHDLKGGLEKFKSDAVSVAWIRRTVEALKRAAARFANTAKAPMIDGTLAAIKEVVKAHAQAALEKIWSALF
jgi:hypothetical protein